MNDISINDIGEYFVITAIVKNSNPVIASDVSVDICKGSKDGEIIRNVDIGSLQLGEMRTVQYIVDKKTVVYDENGLAEIYFVASTSSDERITDDNVVCAVLEYVKENNLVLGDVDGNGEIDDWDSVLLDRYLAGWDVDIDISSADMDGSGEVDDWDSVLLARKLAGWDV